MVIIAYIMELFGGTDTNTRFDSENKVVFLFARIKKEPDGSFT